MRWISAVAEHFTKVLYVIGVTSKRSGHVYGLIEHLFYNMTL